MSQTLTPDRGMIQAPAIPVAPGIDRAGVAPVPLWTPSTLIAVILLFGGFPGALALAIVNWYRMGRKEKALGHFFGSLGLFVLYTGIVYVVDADWGLVIGMALSLILLLYLYSQMKSDIAAFSSGDRATKNAGALQGILVIGAGLVVFLVVVFSVTFTLAILQALGATIAAG